MPPPDPAAERFVDHILELLADIEPVSAPVTARRMFGGHGIFCHGLMFALIADEALYFKVDEASRPAFEAAGLDAFTYRRKDRVLALAYHLAPPEAMENAQAMLPWARGALDAAARAAKKKEKQIRKSEKIQKSK